MTDSEVMSLLRSIDEHGPTAMRRAISVAVEVIAFCGPIGGTSTEAVGELITSAIDEGMSSARKASEALEVDEYALAGPTEPGIDQEYASVGALFDKLARSR